jgi:serine protease Do
MIDLYTYSWLCPEMPYEIVLFFSQSETIDGKFIPKNLLQFCVHYANKFKIKWFPETRVVAKMCDILCDNNQLTVFHRGGYDSIENSYFVLGDQNLIGNPNSDSYFKKKLNYIVYGFRYIYEDFKKYVLPIEYTDSKGDKALGTGFLYANGLITARHCIEGAKQIAIKEIDAADLSKAQFKIPDNKMLDLIYVQFQNQLPDTLMFSEEANILDDVMTLGYPKIPGYHSFLTAENATVAARYTTSIGQVVSNAEDIWIKERLFLITAKIKGGNSGGPVISKKGSIIGVSVNLSQGDGDYDNLGYGTVIPVKFVDKLIAQETKNYLDTTRIEFISFE